MFYISIPILPQYQIAQNYPWKEFGLHGQRDEGLNSSSATSWLSLWVKFLTSVSLNFLFFKRGLITAIMF